MNMSSTLEHFLQDRHVRYDVMPHHHTSYSMETAEAAHVPGDRVAKPVILKDDNGYVMAVIPSTCLLDVDAVTRFMGRRLHLVDEWELKDLFRDCELGAIPPLGPAYGMKTIMDESLAASKDIYFEAGNHEDLIHMDTDTYLGLMAEAARARFSQRTT
jgi:Ala-tRNA(Pro) deacylase